MSQTTPNQSGSNTSNTDKVVQSRFTQGGKSDITLEIFTTEGKTNQLNTGKDSSKSDTPADWKNPNSTLESNGVSVTVVSSPELSTTVNGKSSTASPTSTNVPQFPGSKLQNVPASGGPAPNIIHGTAKCENCGTVGVKHAFYTKQRNYCSASCVKAAQKKTESAEPIEPVKPNTPQNSLAAVDTKSKVQEVNVSLPEADLDDSTSSSAQDTSRPSSAASMSTVSKFSNKKGKAKQTAIQYIPQEPPTYDWCAVLDDPKCEAASVMCFKHVPWSHVWENVTVGMKVEVENKDVCDQKQFQLAFWVASVLKVQGYKVKLRFEGFGNDPSRDFWVNLCSPDVHHVGWCATKGKPLIPPNTIANRHNDWREFLVKRLTGARTLPHNFQTKVDIGLKSRYELGTKLEIVDKMRISQLRLAEVRGCVGKRLNLVYFDSADNEGFWCHEDSSLIHPCGWAATVGQAISAPADYKPPLLLPSELKVHEDFSHIQVKEGMKLEAIDPLNLSVICVATIKKVLKFGYIMVRVDCYEEDPTGSDWFCYHVTSSSIFPCGFCAKNDIPLIPPHGYSKDLFSWDKYLSETGAKCAPLQALHKQPMKVPLKEGMRLEAADLMDPRLVCVATIARVIGHLLKIHFDGWEEEYDQWLDARSPDIYPVGWCEVVKHRLEFPPQPVKPKVTKKAKKHKKGQKFSSADNEVPKKKPKLQLKEPITKKSSTKLAGNDAFASQSKPTVKNVQPGFERKDPHPENRTMENSEDQSVNKILPQEPAVSSTTTGTGTIPKLSDTSKLSDVPGSLDPEKWSKGEVSEFLQRNDCGAYANSFLQSDVDGAKLMALTKDQIIGLTGMKVGPGVKIWDMIQQLKRFVNTANRKSALSK